VRVAVAGRRPRRRDDSGTSLVEMVVTTMVLGVLSAMAMAVTISVQDASNVATTQVGNVGDAQTVIDTLTSDLQAAVTAGTNSAPVTTLQPDTVTFYSDLGAAGGPTEITFALTGTELTQTAIPYPWSGAGTTQVLSNTIDNGTLDAVGPGALSPVLTYFQSDGTTPTTDPAQVGSVKVNLMDNSSKLPDAVGTLSQQVWLRNVSYGSTS
jgi:type II secretory pathway pseudopilin PulG